MGLGVLCGIVMGPYAEYIKPIGTLFLALLNMVIVPLIFTSMVCGITNIPDKSKLGRVGGKTLLMYFTTTLIAIIFGITFSGWLNLGGDVNFLPGIKTEVATVPSLSEIILSAVPKNPIKAFAEANILQIIVFSIFFGSAINIIGIKAAPVVTFMNSVMQVMLRMTNMVMQFSPYGVFALMAWATGSFGLDVLLPVCKFLLSYYVACIIFSGIVFSFILKGMANLKPWPFFKGMTEVMATAASTCSSSATLPITLECAQDKLGVSKNLSSFVLPLGCSLNMNGSALFQAMSAIFIAQCYGITLDWNHYLTLFTTIILATLGTASVPGGGLMMLSIVFASIGVPLEGLAILAGIDRLRDMGTTILNITGDAVCCVYIAKKEGELNEACYYNQGTPELIEVEKVQVS